MQAQLQQLVSAIDNLPGFSSSTSYSELNSILSKYTSVLNYFNGYNEEFKRSTNVFYSDISSIRDDIQRSLYASLPQQKVAAYENASKALRSNIFALKSLVAQEAELV